MTMLKAQAFSEGRTRWAPRPGDPADNAPRYLGSAGRGHVESWFLRANHPTERRAVWLKATLLSRLGDAGTVAEVWCAVFDGERGRTWAARQTVPIEQACLEGDPLRIALAGCRYVLSRDDGEASGALSNERGACRWDVRWRAAPGALGGPLCLLPLRRMVEGGFPRSKLLTPAPVLHFEGTLRMDGETLEIRDWLGMQGHNWGQEHAFAYAWGQCVFPDAQGAPLAMVEGFSGRIRLAGLTTPWLSAMVVRRGDEEWRFDRIVDLWRQTPEVGDLSWGLRMRGRDGEAYLGMAARASEVVCLGYRNPDGTMAHCLNSKLARTVLRVNPANQEGFECRSEHAGALEFLRRDPDPRFPVAA